jgi:predicted ATPase
MCQIRVQNFGPIHSGLLENDGFIEVKKLTVFIGNQGTGKSSIAKLLSTFMWLEKSLYRGLLSIKEVEKNKQFVNKYCVHHRIHNYFKPNTEIEYKGTSFNFLYKNEKIHVLEEQKNKKEYAVPKIMYVPAERNFLSILEHPETVKDLPQSLYTFLDEFQRSKEEVGALTIPFSNKTTFQFQKQHKIAYIIGENYKLKLSEASSGMQSLLPVFLVSHNLSRQVSEEREDFSKQELNYEEHQNLKSEIQAILSNETLTTKVKQGLLELLSKQYYNAAFVNIVEEIEQNLFPKTQKDLLYWLLTFANKTAANKLILTTHSPYIINYLTLAMKANTIYDKSGDDDEVAKQIDKIVPTTALISSNTATIYTLTEQGTIHKLPMYADIPSDEYNLNTQLFETNLLFDKLLDLEEAIV